MSIFILAIISLFFWSQCLPFFLVLGLWTLSSVFLACLSFQIAMEANG